MCYKEELIATTLCSAAQYGQANQKHSEACDNCEKALASDQKMYTRSARPLKTALPKRIETRFSSARQKTRDEATESASMIQSWSAKEEDYRVQ